MFEKVRGLLHKDSKIGKLNNVAIIGGNSLLGQHVFSQLLEFHIQSISVWTFNESFINRLEVNNNTLVNNVHYFVGLDNLKTAIYDCDTVFNLHEFQDFSNSPNKKLLQKHNVDFVKILLSGCAESGVTNLIHVSSVYLQCSACYPNVGSREQDSGLFIHDNPFPAYFNSKREAESLISECDQLKSIVARIGLLYGEGDRCSVICDAIKLADKFGHLPIINSHGTVQFTYAGNAASVLIKCAEKIVKNPTLQKEIINISDHTPVHSFFDGIARDCFESGDRSFSSWHIPFWLFFPIYFLISMLGYFIDFIPFIKNPLSNMPSASYLYFLFNQWTFIDDHNLRLLLDFTPPFDENESLHRSLKYYGKRLNFIDIKNYSWKATSES